MAAVDDEDLNSKNPVNQEAPEKKGRTAAADKQALSEIASGLKALADSSTRQHQMLIKAEREREERYMAFHKEESEKNREYESRIAEILSRSHQQFPMQQPQQSVTSHIESQFLSYHMQTLSSSRSTRKVSDPYQPQKAQYLWDF